MKTGPEPDKYNLTVSSILTRDERVKHCNTFCNYCVKKVDNTLFYNTMCHIIHKIKVLIIDNL